MVTFPRLDGLRRDRITAMPTGVRHVVAVIAVVHGIAHTAGAVQAVSAIDDGTSVRYLAGALRITDPSALRAVGIAWAVAGALMIVAGIAVWLGLAAWPRVLLVAAAVSLPLCVLAIWASVLGIPISLALGALALAGIEGGRRHERHLAA